MDYFFGKEPRLVYSSKVAASSPPRSLVMKVLPGPIPPWLKTSKSPTNFRIL